MRYLAGYASCLPCLGLDRIERRELFLSPRQLGFDSGRQERTRHEGVTLSCRQSGPEWGHIRPPQDGRSFARVYRIRLERFFWHRWQAAGLWIVIGNGREPKGLPYNPVSATISQTASPQGPISRRRFAVVTTSRAPQTERRPTDRGLVVSRPQTLVTCVFGHARAAGARQAQPT